MLCGDDMFVPRKVDEGYGWWSEELETFANRLSLTPTRIPAEPNSGGLCSFLGDSKTHSAAKVMMGDHGSDAPILILCNIEKFEVGWTKRREEVSHLPLDSYLEKTLASLIVHELMHMLNFGLFGLKFSWF